jgi:hypothetical protein
MTSCVGRADFAGADWFGNFWAHSKGVIPRPGDFSRLEGSCVGYHYPCLTASVPYCARDPSLRLKNGFGRDDGCAGRANFAGADWFGNFWAHSKGVIPRPVDFSRLEGSCVVYHYPCLTASVPYCARDPSLRLKNGFGRDDACAGRADFAAGGWFGNFWATRRRLPRPVHFRRLEGSCVDHYPCLTASVPYCARDPSLRLGFSAMKLGFGRDDVLCRTRGFAAGGWLADCRLAGSHRLYGCEERFTAGSAGIPVHGIDRFERT